MNTESQILLAAIPAFFLGIIFACAIAFGFVHLSASQECKQDISVFFQ